MIFNGTFTIRIGQRGQNEADTMEVICINILFSKCLLMHLQLKCTELDLAN